MKEIAITLIVSEEDFDKSVKKTLKRFAKHGIMFPKEHFKETAKIMSDNEDNIVELSKGEPEIMVKHEIIEAAIMEKSLQRMKNGKFDKLTELLTDLLELKEDENDNI